MFFGVVINNRNYTIKYLNGAGLAFLVPQRLFSIFLSRLKQYYPTHFLGLYPITKGFFITFGNPCIKSSVLLSETFIDHSQDIRGIDLLEWNQHAHKYCQIHIILRHTLLESKHAWRSIEMLLKFRLTWNCWIGKTIPGCCSVAAGAVICGGVAGIWGWLGMPCQVAAAVGTCKPMLK